MLRPLYVALLLAGASTQVAANTDLMTIYRQAVLNSADLAAAEAGASAIIQPGGSIRDDEVIAAADERGLAMAFTGMRHFRP